MAINFSDLNLQLKMIYVKIVGVWIKLGMNEILLGINFDSTFKSVSASSSERILENIKKSIFMQILII